MKLDANLAPTPLAHIPQLASAVEAMGFDGLWTNETRHDPFLPVALAAEHTRRITLTTGVAIAFARSPTVLAHNAWDLAALSGGRFRLGLGTQVRAHVERRFGMPWPASPVSKLREQIRAIRSLWKTWQTGERLNVRGEYFTLTLMTPFFNPGPMPHPDIPIHIAGVNRGLCRLAGEVADGFVVHPYHSAAYLQEVIKPAIAEGARGAGRSLEAVSISVTAFIATNEEEQNQARAQLAFYASTPSYRPVMDLHGWGPVADALRALAARGAWAEMAERIDPEMLRTFAVVGTESELPDLLQARYGGRVDHLSLYWPFVPGQRDAFWRRLIDGLKSL